MTRTVEDIARDLFLEVGQALLGTRWADDFARLNPQPEKREEKWAA